MRANRERKSVGADNTFNEDLFAFEAMYAVLEPISDKVCRIREAKKLSGRTVKLKVKYADFRQITRSQSSVRRVALPANFDCAALALLRPLMPVQMGMRLLGLTISSLAAATDDASEIQLRLSL